jgi:hypothetical protein
MDQKTNSRRAFIKQTLTLTASSSLISSLYGGQAVLLKKSNTLNLPDLSKEIRRTQSEYTVYVPKSADGSTADNGNEHFLVFPGPDGSLMAVWTQSTTEGHGDHRIVFSKSTDKGRTWAEPTFLAGVRAGEGKPIRVGTGKWQRPDHESLPNIESMASWGYPMVSKSGRIYVVYNQYQGVADVHYQFTGTMDAIYSDDNGQTWSRPQTIPMKRSIWDHPDPSVPANWIVWQRPHRDLQDRWYVGFTRWISKAVRHSREGVQGLWRPAVIEFMRYENIDEDPEPKDIKISWFASDHKALKVPHPEQPAASAMEEPSITRLPDNRLFCTMRTLTHYIWYSTSKDDGETWSATKPLLYHDHGQPIISPVFCTPIYRLDDGRYILIHHPAYKIPKLAKKYNVPERGGYNRRPAFIAVGEYRPNAEQPIWFSESKLFMDNDGVGVGPRGIPHCGGYTSLTSIDGETVLWHPDRKFFLLGKIITDDFLSDMQVPKSI